MKIILGTAQFGLHYGIANVQGRIDENEIKKILDLAIQKKINYIDTAIAYGESEKIIGKYNFDNFKIITKISSIPKTVLHTEKWIRNQVLASIKRLEIKKLEALLLHDPNQILDKNGSLIIKTLVEMKSEGFINKIGISIYNPSQIQQYLDIYKFDIIQAPLNILDQRMIQTGWMTLLKSSGIEFHARSIFLQGLLLMANKPNQFDKWEKLWDQLDDWLDEEKLTAMQACVRFVLSQKDVSAVVLGVDSATQLNQILSTGNDPLNEFPLFMKNINDEKLLNPGNWNLL